MPTFNQLVRKGRQVLATKSTAPALLKSCRRCVRNEAVAAELAAANQQ